LARWFCGKICILYAQVNKNNVNNFVQKSVPYMQQQSAHKKIIKKIPNLIHPTINP
jgi:hypothetical protein